MSIRKQILTTMLVVTLVPLGLASWFVYRENIPRITDTIDRKLVVLADEIAREIDTFLRGNVETIRADSHIPGLAEFLNGDAPYRKANEHRVMEILRNVIVKDPVNVTSCGLLDLSGKNILDTNSSQRGCDEGTSPYLTKAVTTGLPVVSGLYTSPCTKEPGLFVSVPLRNEQGTILGVLRIRYEAAILQQLVMRDNNIPDIDQPHAILLDQEGMVIAHGQDPSLQLNSRVVLNVYDKGESLKESQKGFFTLTTSELVVNNGRGFGWGSYRGDAQGGRRDRIIFKDLQYMPWRLGIFIHAEAYSQPVRRAELFLFFGFLLSTALVWLAAHVAAQRIAGPIVALTGATRHIAAGNFEPIAGLKASGEVEILLQTFNGMTMRLNKTLQGLETRYQEQLKAEVALRDSEKKYRIMTRLTGLLVYDYDVESGVIVWSGAISELTGYSSTEFQKIGIEQWENLIHEEDRTAAVKLLAEVVESGLPYCIEYRFLRKDGRIIFVEDNGSFLRDGQGKAYRMLGNMKDITASKQLEENLRQSQKMEAIGTLAGGIAHDFNNILSGIIGYTELAQINMAPGTPGLDDLQEVLKSADRAKELVRQILTFSRKSQEERKAVDIALIVTEVINLLRSTIPTTITIETKCTDTQAQVNADPTQIHQVILNLCTNAAQAMADAGGVLNVTVSTLVLEPQALEGYHNLAPGPFVTVTVTDTGSGIDSTILHRIFDPFFTTKEKERGTGMGLAVVHGIVKDHGGDVVVESVLDQGTAFTVLLPQVRLEPVAKLKIIPEMETGNEHILFVDDEEMLTKLWTLQLQSLGYRITACNSSLEALQRFRQSPDSYDLVITDHTMPNMTGFTMAEEMLTIKASTRIILCTGYSESLTAEKVEAAGIKVLLYKPVRRNQLAQTIHEVMEQ